MGEAVESARAAVSLADAVDADVDLAEDAAPLRLSGAEAEPAGGEVGRDAHRAGMGGDLEQVVQLERLAPAERDVEDAHRGELVEDAARFIERQRGRETKSAGVPLRVVQCAALQPSGMDPEGLAQLAHHFPIDVEQGARARDLDDAAEALGAGADHLELHGVRGRRRSAPSISARALAKMAPKSRKVTSTPSELEFGLQPKVARNTRPFRKIMRTSYPTS